MMAKLSAARAVAAATAFALTHAVDIQPPQHQCIGNQCQDDDSTALLSSKISVHRAAGADLGQVILTQRADDLIPALVPKTQTPAPLAERDRLPIPMPNPAPNPADNPFIANYTPQNCMGEDLWPFFSRVDGDWYGHAGQSFTALPQWDARPQGKMFLVQVNNYSESTSFESIGGPVLNRGYLDAVQVNPTGQSDQVLTGTLYLQKVMDNDLEMGIHEENGQILHKACVEVNENATDPWNVLRQGAIPHGSQPMGFGNLTVVETPDAEYYVQMLLRVRETYEYSVQPFVPGCGPQMVQQREQAMGTAENVVRLTNEGPLKNTQCCIGTSNYMRGMDQCPMTGCPEPIDTLIQRVKGLNIIKYVQLNMTSGNSIPPIVPRGAWVPDIQGGGVQNTGFVNLNAQAESRSFRNLWWLLTVRREDGSTYELQQYLQTANLRFLAAAPGCPDQVWPHVQANTLQRADPQPDPFSPTPAPSPSPAPTPTPPPHKAGCYTQCCGCPGKEKQKWCSPLTSWMGPLCSKSRLHCDMCLGKWCRR